MTAGTDTMRIAVIGAGGVGGVFGAALAKAGCDVPRCPLLRLLSESELTWVRHCRTVANDPNADLGGVFVQHLRTLARAPKALAGPLPVLLHYWIVSYHA